MPKQSDGRYRAKVTVGHDEDGNPIIKYVSGRTKKELEANKAALRQRYVDGLEDVRQNVTFGVYAAEWLRVYKLPGLSASSQGLYNGFMEKHIIPAFAQRRVAAIRAADIQKLLNDYSDYSQTSTNYIRHILQGVFRQAVRDGIVTRDPSIGLTKTGVKPSKRRGLTEQEIAAVLSMIGATQGNGSRLLAILYYTGLRRGDAYVKHGLKNSELSEAPCKAGPL